MNDNHRKLIMNNIDKLVAGTNYKTVMDACLNKEDLLTETMQSIIERDGHDDEDKKCELLFKKLTHRGPTAFYKILQIMDESGYEEAHKILTAPTVPSATFNADDASCEENFLSISSTTNRRVYNRPPSYSPPSPSNNIINNNNNNKISLPTNGDTLDTKTLNDGCFPSKVINSKLTPYPVTSKFQFDGNLEVKRAANFGSHPKLQVYSMKSKRRGVFFFVNIVHFKAEKKDRLGAEKDRDNLVTLFSEMNYTVFYYEDLTRTEFFDLVRELKKSEYLKGIDSFIMCIQTHGDLYQNQTIMEFTDGTTTCVDEVVGHFSNVNCENLAHKPKVFFFPFCRGGISDQAKRITLNVIQTDGLPGLVPSFSDILICYATVPGFMTHRDTKLGSWYVQELCKVFAEHACDCHIENLLKMVSTNTMKMRDQGRIQVASTESRGFDKLLYLNPKIFD